MTPLQLHNTVLAALGQPTNARSWDELEALMTPRTWEQVETLGMTWQQAEAEPPTFPVITGEVLETPGPDYAVVLPGGGRNESTRLSDHANRFVWSVRVMAVSATPQGCMAVADWVRTRLDRLRVGMATLRDDSWDNLMPLPDGPANDRRYSLTLDFTIITTRSTT